MDCVVHTGGCHCGRVRFEVEAPAAITVTDCNCSVCTKTGYLHLIVPKSRFKLLQGEEFLTNYRFNTGAAQHLFCKVCGIKSSYAPRSHIDKGEDIMVKILAAALVLGLAGTAWAQKKECAELKSEIEAKIKKNGVDKFSLEIVDKDAQADGKVVGTCDAGAKKIVYKKG